MLIGILSDSHGRVDPVRRALDLFQAEKVAHVIHCGDVGGEPVLDALAGHPVSLVWGNTDFPSTTVLRYARALGLHLADRVPLLLELGGKKIAVFHGHEAGFSRAHETLEVDLIFYGHTHRRHDERLGDVRRINPGALHRVDRKTVALLDLATDDLRFVEIE